MMSCIFFCKQKTAYEMRISDWSSDVCSSDLLSRRRTRAFTETCTRRGAGMSIFGPFIAAATASRIGLGISTFAAFFIARRQAARATLVDGWVRSEEHTSELQSLMRISYAVFCLKKKKKT